MVQYTLMKRLLTALWWLPRTLLLHLITLYQQTLSPDHGPLKGLHPYGFCRHHPTCSEYGKEMIWGRGAVIGTLLTFRRLLSCHPWKRPDPARVLEVLS